MKTIPTVYLFAVSIVGYIHTRTVQILARDSQEAAAIARRTNPGGLAYNATQKG